MIHPLRPAIPRLPRPRPRLERRAARGHSTSAPLAVSRLHATAGSAAPTRARCAPSPTCPPAARGPRLSPTVPGGGQPKATREALCLACPPACCPQRSALVTRPLHNPRCDGCPCPSIAAPLSCPRSPFASSPASLT